MASPRARYLTTKQATPLLRCTSVMSAWNILMDTAGVRPVGRDGRHLIWRAEDVIRVAEYRAAYSVTERRRRATILRGIRQRRAKREARDNA